MKAYFILNSANRWSGAVFLVNWLLFGLLLVASWYGHPLFSLVSFVPYFNVLFQAKKGSVYYAQLFVLNLTWNGAVTYWICQLRPLKGLATLITNSLLFLLPVLVWQLFCYRGFLKKGEVLLLLVCWLGFEYLHHVWDFSWTWLTVGNVFGSGPEWVLWYVYAGVMGGSAWILASNYLIYDAIRSSAGIVRKWFMPTFIVLLPVVISLGISAWRSAQPAGTVSHVTAITMAIRDKDSVNDIRKLSIIDSLLVADKRSKDIVLLPEVLLTNDIWIDRFPQSRQYTVIKQSLNRWRASHVVIGAQLNVADSVDLLAGKPASGRGSVLRIRSYNAALMIDTSDIVSIKLKKVLVPIEEYVPSYLSFLKLTSNGYTINRSNADVFSINGKEYLIGICYEMVNSIFTGSKVRPQTNAILMLSSESFFGPSEVGRKQYMGICRLRCVENNLPLVKSSNEGITLSVAAGGDLLDAKRALWPGVTHTIVKSPGVSFYYLIVPWIPWCLFCLLATILLVNFYLAWHNRRHKLNKAGNEQMLFPGFTNKDNVIKT